MLKKSLLASIAFMSINPIAAHDQPPADAGTTHGSTAHGNTAHGGTAHGGSTPGSSNCPPCPCGGVQGWVLIPAGPGTPCHQGAGATPPEEEAPHHHQPVADHHPEPAHHKPAMHPDGRTPEQQKLEEELHPITPHIFLRANPHSPTPNKKEGEWGKELHGKVYFRHLGNWVYDPSVKPSDIVSTGVKDKIKMFGGGKTPAATNPAAAAEAHKETAAEAHKETAAEAHKEAAAEAHKEAVAEAHKETAAEAHKEAVAEAHKEAAAETAGVAPPPPTAGPVSKGGWTKDANGRWTRNTPPDALGTTARPNTVDEKGRPIQGSFNRAQTGQTGEPAPHIDASANSPQPAGN